MHRAVGSMSAEPRCNVGDVKDGGIFNHFSAAAAAALPAFDAYYL